MQKNNTAVQAGKPNKLADWPIRTLILSMGMPMVLSMVLQAVYNIVDTIFAGIHVSFTGYFAACG